jgi:hypothetical protein
MTGKNEYRLSDDGLTAHIALTQGKETIVDVCDLELVLRFRWHALRIRKAFYAVTRLPRANGKQPALYMHQLLFGKGCDHIDRNGLNNRRGNLRRASAFQQARNQGRRKNNTSGLSRSPSAATKANGKPAKTAAGRLAKRAVLAP